MGLCFSNNEEERRNKIIDQDMKRAQVIDKQVRKILLLGSGESGKSTIFKQVSSLYKKPYTVEELKKFDFVVYSNLFEALLTLSEKNATLFEQGKLETKVGNEALAAIQTLVDIQMSGTLYINKQVGDDIRTIWADPGIQETFQHRATFQFNDSTVYFIDRLEAIEKDDYIPTFDDALRTRVRTTGATVLKFLMEKQTVLIVDVGGQKSERTKWIHQFEGVSAILFVTAVCDYDRTMFEDEKCNRMQDSLDLFESCVKLDWFKDTSIILFLNKRDLFENKFPNSPLSVCFPDWDDAIKDYEAAYSFIGDRFLERMASTDPDQPAKQLILHVTCATDTNNIDVVFTALKNIILSAGLAAVGILE